MQIEPEIAKVLIEAAKSFKGASKRKFMAKVVNCLGRGGQRAAEKHMKWCRNTIIKGQHELRTNITCADNYKARGNKKAEERHPKLLEHIEAIVSPNSQADPSMNSERLYLKITASSVREELKKRYGYDESELPVTRTISNKLNEMGYSLQKVRKTIPLKKFQKQI